MELSTMAIVSWLAQPAAAALVNVAQQYLMQRLGLGSSPPAASGVKPLLDDYLQKLTARLDEDRIAKLYGAFSTLLDAPLSVARHGLLIEALDRFHEVAQIPEQGMTGGRPNAELRCMALVGMAASHTLLGDRLELIVEKMVEAVSADADTAKRWFSEDLIREILSRFPPPGVICPKCGFQNPAGSRFCNQDGSPLTQHEVPEAIVQTFNPVWYYHANNVWQAILLSASGEREAGRLIVRNNSLEFQGKKERVLMTHIKSISIEMPNYIKVTYGDDAKPSSAFFTDAGAFGYRSLFGGTELLADTLQRTYFSQSCKPLWYKLIHT